MATLAQLCRGARLEFHVSLCTKKSKTIATSAQQMCATRHFYMKFNPHTVQTRCPSPLGDMVLAATDHGLAGAWFDGQRHQPAMEHWPTAPTG